MDQDKKVVVKKIAAIISNVVLVVLFVVGVTLTISILPIRGNYRILSVVSGSMEPTIDTGSLIVVKPIDEYKQDDIITFCSTDSVKEKDSTTHRIVGKEEMDGFVEYRTKGDANETEDPDTVKPSQIIGKQFFSIKYLGYVLMYIKTLPGLLFLIIVPATLIVYEEVKKIRREAKRIIAERNFKQQQPLRKEKTKKKISKNKNVKKS